MHNTQNAPVKITKAANARDNTPALTTVTVQKTLQQPLTLGHLITTLAGVALGALIMTCVQTTTAKQTNPTTTGSVVTSNQTTPEETDIVLPPSALAPTLREHAESQVSSHDLQNVGNTLTVTAESAYALLSDEHYDDAIAAYHTLLRTDPTMEPERGYLIEALGQSPS
ncbi:MAG: hypothetical protein JO253_04280, partial [Alphaproteobacteria bacterium]|nr:hypothetical protein [Alphaproteobacteria bacterium]